MSKCADPTIANTAMSRSYNINGYTSSSKTGLWDLVCMSSSLASVLKSCNFFLVFVNEMAERFARPIELFVELKKANIAGTT